MQNVSERYIEQINKTVRNRGHIHVTIEIINQKAQYNATVINGQNSLVYFSTPNANDLFHDDIEPEYYATDELDFTKVDGSMFFAPAQGSGATFRENGIVTDAFNGEIKITFDNGVSDLDIKGLTIDFGEFYPTRLQIITDNSSDTYDNSSSVFVAKKIFYGVSYVRVIPLAMLNGSRRMRIVGFKFGLIDEFYDSKVMDFSNNDYISPIGDSVPSRDMNLNIDNRDRNYTPDNPESSIVFLEVGQRVKAQFGYDLDQHGNETEWLDPIVGYLSNWSANTSTATFTATDKYNELANTTYYRGLYRPSGISLYDLALDVLEDAGYDDSRDYSIDESLEDITVYNPIPVVKHSEALQIIANAGRCTLSIDRKGKIQIEKAVMPEFPDWSASSNGETSQSDVTKVIRYNFESKTQDKNYYSSSVYEDDEWNPSMPVITLTPEEALSLYHMTIKFLNTYPEELTLNAYDDSNELIKTVVCHPHDLSFTVADNFVNISRLDIEFTKGSDGHGIEISDIIIEDIWGLTIDSSSMKQSPTATRQSKLASVSAVRTMYEATGEQKELNKGTVTISPTNNVYTVNFSDPSYNKTVTLTNASGITATITDYSDFFVEITFSGMSTETDVEYQIYGYPYEVSYINEKVVYAKNGEEIVWSNPLVSTPAHARALAEWVGDYYDDDLAYDVAWRGDPRVDANDILSMETVMGDIVLVKLSRNTLSYNGAWSGSLQARKVV